MQVRLLQAADLHAYRAVRLRGLREHAEAFGTSPEEFSASSDADVLRQLTANQPHNATMGAFVEGALVGVITVHRHHRQKTRHRAHISGMYVLPEQRGQGIGKRLLDAGLDHLRGLDGVQQVILAVTAGNDPARRLYRGAGFITWGVDPAYIRVGNVYHDIEWMVLWL